MSEQPSSKILTEIFVGLLVTIIGGIIVAWYIREGERFQSSQMDSVSIALTSHYCAPQDFYVDGEKVISSIYPDATVAFKTSKGDHWVYPCSPMTNVCGDTVLINWNKATSYTIEVDDRCPITITLSNEHCVAQDYYVDGNLVVSAIAPNSTANFETNSGKHETATCVPGTNTCADKLVVEWTTSTTQYIARGSQCP